MIDHFLQFVVELFIGFPDLVADLWRNKPWGRVVLVGIAAGTLALLGAVVWVNRG